MKCPYCGAKLHKLCDDDFDCSNSECKGCYPLPLRFWQDLIDGKKARQQLRTVKDRCVKKVKAKEREIANYLNGISVRQSENERLAKQLKLAQDALKEIAQHDINNQRGEPKSYVIGYDEIKEIAITALQDTKE